MCVSKPIDNPSNANTDGTHTISSPCPHLPAPQTTNPKPQEPVNFVKGLLEMRDKFERIVAESFAAEKAAQKKLQEAFEVR